MKEQSFNLFFFILTGLSSLNHFGCALKSDLYTLVPDLGREGMSMA